MRNLKLEARLEKAFGFVQENGSELMQELSATAVGQMRSDDMLTRLMKYQNSDGGWWGLTELKAPISTISSTINGLHWLLMIEERNSSSLDRTVTFLKKTQKRNGCWDEPEEILTYNPKSWMLPGEYANQLWFTSAICRYLSEHGRETDVEFDAAISFLRAGWDGERYPMYPHTHWMSMNVFGRLVNPSETDRQIVEGCKEILIDAIWQNTIGPLMLVEIAHAALKTVPPSLDLFETAFQKILESQADDGGWIIDHGDLGDRVLATTRIMLLLKIVALSERDET
jgi:hypothetical protein